MESPGVLPGVVMRHDRRSLVGPPDEDEQDLDDGLEEVDGEDVYRLGSFDLSSGTFCGELRQHYA